MENQTKIPFYKKKVLMIPLVAVFAMMFVSATIMYFHSVQVDFTVSEARSSEDIAVSLPLVSGETASSDKVIHNSANVELCAELSWEELTNPNSVTYSSNMPLLVRLAPVSYTTATVTITADPLTEAGVVTGNINYQKVACP